ncbi:hydrolase [uncultured Dokdonia sp.]|uniref:hydrolase n=1 Tax=uncultured Dokdonia sp. TaxID=575653 RepID=UPI00260E5369|nr:hydrolase [uncultured Dokdonia sp.]
MRRNIFLYLFLFAALYIIFQSINSSKGLEYQERRINKLEKKIAKKDSLYSVLEDRLANTEYFTLLGNENTKEYFDNDNLVVEDIKPVIVDGLYAKNTAKGNDLINFVGDGRPFQINRVQVLNHRWIIADFSDGKKWGELLVEYFVNEDGSVDYNRVESLVYPN